VATLAKAMTLRFSQDGLGWKVWGAALNAMGKSADALAPMRRAAALAPKDSETQNILGVILKDLGRLDEAEASLRRALQIKPDYADVHNNLGITFKDLGRLDEAEASLRRALQLKGDCAEAHNNLGLTLKDLSRVDEAEASLRLALQIKPDYADAYSNLGVALKDLDRLDEAEASFRRALQVKPNCIEALNNLALLLDGQGKSVMALNIIQQSLLIKATAEAKCYFVDVLKRLRLTHVGSGIRTIVTRALSEPWGRPSDLERICTEIVKLQPQVGSYVARASEAWPQRLSAQALFDEGGIATLAHDPLLCALLNSTPICELGMERFLTMARHAMLDIATGMANSSDEIGSSLTFYSALACQCFINEYVFSSTDDELEKARNLRDSLLAALEARRPVPALWPVTVAAYFPLHSIPTCARLLDFEWPEAVKSLLAQQIKEPEDEAHLCAAIPRLTPIEDKVSLLVQGQYQENPYPRWVKVAPARTAANVGEYLCRKFPLASFDRSGKGEGNNVLIAGCGTGRHPIETARQFPRAQLLAVDLSMSSLGYAKRKSRELGLTSIEYAQADLLKLDSLGKSFDVIESLGVLHHLADPWGGWRMLLSLLRPGGFMKLGFYSEVARRDVVKARDFIAARGYGSSAEDIRKCRQDLIDGDGGRDFRDLFKFKDMFSTSECRDLLFHVQEQRMTLVDIEAFLRENKLTFLGFDIDANIIQAYKQRFPGDRAATSLEQWQSFELDNPNTFSAMYQFWIQKAS